MVKRKRKNNNITAIIGIGASAGGLEPLQALVSNLPDNLDNVAIIVAQHMSPNYESKLVDLIKRKTNLEVMEGQNGVLLKKNTIFIAPPNHNIEVRNLSIYLSQTNEIGPKPSINLLFESIAKGNGNIMKVGVILSGTGNDGTKGMATIKKMGGTTIAQEPSTAKYDGMPYAAINSGNVQMVMEPHVIGKCIPEILMETHEPQAAGIIPISENGNAVDKIIKALSDRMGVNFNGYKTSTLYRRLDKRMSDSHFLNVEDYLRHIKDHPEELDVLFQNVLIGVTQFFRDPEAFKEIREILEISLRQDVKNSFRIWVPGCATGEEAYSMAIIVHQLNSDLSKINVQIFATDIDENALNVARRGIYPPSAVETVPEDILKKYFDKTESGYEVSKVIRKMVLFSRHDLTSNPPFLRTNLISCRNLMIYFDNELQNQIIPMFHYSLANRGYLFLGKSETIGDFNNLFSTISQKQKIYQKKEGNSQFIKLPYLKLISRSSTSHRPNKKDNEDISVAEMVKETFYHAFDHPYVVIDENMELVEVSGDVSHVMSLKPGPASSNALKLIDKNLQIELRAVVGQCFRTGEAVKGNIRRLKKNDGEAKTVRLAARPLLFSRSGNPLYLVVFEHVELENNTSIKDSGNVDETDNVRIIELEHELAATKEHMNTLIEELETFNEELQATNEELQSSNEELQASNEELETSNEELQSTNEELEIAYNELRAASDEIERQNRIIKQSENNLKTVFNNTLQGFVLVDKKYTIALFNKTASDIFQNAYGKRIKVGESFIDLIAPEELEDFYKNFQLALKGRLIADKVLIRQDQKEDIWLNYNYSPVMDSDNKQIDHVIISFIDNTKHNMLMDQRDKLLEELRERNEELKKTNQNLDHFVHIIAHDLRSPLGNIKMVAHQFENSDLEEVNELTPLLHQCVDRLDNTINGLVKIIEIEGAQNVIEPGIDFEEVINDVKYELRNQIHESGATIKMINISGRRINYIKAFLTSIFYNLISNAIKYHKEGMKPEIIIELTPVKFGYEVIFSDSGLGIDLNKYKDSLFTPFKRISKNGKMGLGVGMHMVKKMIEKNGGIIDVESEEGKGTTFRIFLKEYHA